ncbi:trypsin-like serine peptidase [Streptomyces sp. MS2.AVA.5]|uniref:Trypsin-like serine protease n=1 Tax=Streptomyces achmelvichensis TaxID=3134111 RepID=A0ACC6Q199_9ACTN
MTWFALPKRLPRWPAVALLTAVTACGGPVSATPDTGDGPSPLPPGPSPQSSAAPFAGPASAGVLLDEDGVHYCSASVVDSPRGNVVATAAHCVFEYGSYMENVTFAPGFTGPGNGKAPYGRWKVRAIQVDDRWRRNTDASDAVDYAFLTLEPDAKGRDVQDVVGGTPVDWASSAERRVTVVGYPNAEHNPQNRPISCTTDTRQDPELDVSLLMECAGFWDGTSGGPWLADYRNAEHPGRIIGVTSGGQTDRESTAVRFTADARRLYDKAAKA